jgi:hypothetical protein
MSTVTVVPEANQVVPETTTEKKNLNILDSAMLLSVVRRFPPLSKTVKDKSIVQTNAQPGMFSLNKKLWDCQEIKNIFNNESKLDQFIKFHSTMLPLRAGNYLVAVDLFHKVENRFVEHMNKREELINAFVAVYDDAVKKSKELLGDQFKSTDYPTAAQVKGLFYFGWSWLNFSVSGKLAEIDKEMATRKANQLEGEIHQAAEMQKDLLRKEMSAIVNHLVERFTPKENAEGELKKKVIRDTVLDKWEGFKEVFPAKNLAEDDKLAELVDQAEALLTGVSPEQIRTNDMTREDLQKGFELLKTSIDKLLVDEPSRSISFEEL